MPSFQLKASDASPQTSNFAPVSVVYGTNFPVGPAALYDPSATQNLFYSFRMPSDYTGSPSIEIDWEAAATTGAVKWECAIASMASNAAASVETKAFATAQSTTTTVSGTANGPNRTTISITNTDSTAAGHNVNLRVSRIGGDAADTMSGNAIQWNLTFVYS